MLSACPLPLAISRFSLRNADLRDPRVVVFTSCPRDSFFQPPNDSLANGLGVVRVVVWPLRD